MWASMVVLQNQIRIENVENKLNGATKVQFAQRRQFEC